MILTNKKKELIRLATQQQMSAADPEKSVWVEASAGTGKTKVLSDRVLRLLLAKVNPAKILCLTYTKAAAVEMNERIAKRLSTWAVEGEEELAAELSRLLGNDFNGDGGRSCEHSIDLLKFARTLFATLLDTPGGMKIQTIHSFCQDILKRFPLEAGISPYFEVMDDRSSKEILQKIKVELLKQADTGNQNELAAAISYLTQNVSEYKFPEIMNMITENRSKIAALLKNYDNDMNAIIRKLEGKLEVTTDQTEEEIKSKAMLFIDRQQLKTAANIFGSGGKEDQQRAEIFTAVAADNFSAAAYPCIKAFSLRPQEA